MKEGQKDDAWLLSENQATAYDHLFFRMGADYIRIRSRQAWLCIFRPIPVTDSGGKPVTIPEQRGQHSDGKPVSSGTFAGMLTGLLRNLFPALFVPAG